MADTERKFQPSPEELVKFRTTVDALVRRGAVREEARGLLDVLQNGHTWGLPEDHIDASRRVLSGFLGRGYLFPEDVQELLAVVKQEEKSARVNWELRRKNAAAVARRLSRLVVFTGVLAVGALSAPPAISTVGDLYYQAYLSPEAIVRAQEENLQKQTRENEEQLKKQEGKLQLEQAMMLGLDWSVESDSGWRIHYLPFDPAIEYQEVNYSGSSAVVSSGYYISLSKSPEERTLFGDNKDDLWIGAAVYKRFNGERIPELKINPKLRSSTITVLLRDESGSNIDTRVVHAFQTDSQREKYLKITMVPGQDVLRVTQMKPVRTGS